MPMNPTHILNSAQVPETLGETLAVKGRRIMTNAEKLFGGRTQSGSVSLQPGNATRRDARRLGLAVFVAALVVLIVFGWCAAPAQAQKTPGVKQVTVIGTITAITTDAPLSPTDIFEGGTITVGTRSEERRVGKGARVHRSARPGKH